MKKLFCSCGQAIYFDNHRCAACNRQLAFDPRTLTMLSTIEGQSAGDGLVNCSNRNSAIRCNWITRQDAAEGLCLSCRTSKIIPILSKPANRERWRKLELAKRRLLYDLLAKGLPIDTNEMHFMFKEDRKSNPNVFDEHVSIGHSKGEITINAAEADDTYRERMRQAMQEPYRTLLGHFRHESGHYYFDIVVSEANLAAARVLFGDEREDYASALRNHYENGPQTDWWTNYISSYASSHPSEDWAETWAHYLHISAVLETAKAYDLLQIEEGQRWHAAFVGFALKINEVSRSLGLADAYPFTLSAPVIEKLQFVHHMIRQYSSGFNR